MENLKVLKRDGNIELFDVDKIKASIAYACDGLGVNPIVLEAKFDQFLFDGITTSVIQNNLVLHATNLTRANDTDWVKVAGRLRTMDRWNRTRLYEKPFEDFVYEMISSGVYKHPALLKYSIDDLKEVAKVINKNYDLDHSISSVVSFDEKCIREDEVIQYAHMVNALIYASVESVGVRLTKAKEWYLLFAQRKISLASPHWLSLRFNGNTGSCFVLAVNDSIESIMDNAKRTAQISKEGGGVGTYWGYVRAKGDSIQGDNDRSGGVIPMMKIYESAINAFDQKGKRKGAMTAALPIWHKDIVEFLDSISEVGDLRGKLFDVQLQVVFEDLFMDKVENDKQATWCTFSPYEVEKVLGFNLNDYSGLEFDEKYQIAVDAYLDGKLTVVSEIKVIELWKLFLQQAFEKGIPYATFGSPLQYKNPNKHCGKIHSFNLCTESSSNISPDQDLHVCSLASVVVGRAINKEDLIYLSGETAHILANNLILTQAPVDLAKSHIDKYRTIGVGIQGLADWLAKNYLTYDDLDEITEVSELIQYGAVRKSVELSKKYGSYPMFEGSRWDTGEQIDDYIKDSVSELTDWEAVKRDVKEYGVYMSQHTSPAPNTTTSINMDAAAGVSQVYSGFFYEDNILGVTPVVSMYLKDNPIFYSESFGEMNQVKFTKVYGAIQKFVDTGVSAEYLLDRNFTKVTAKYIHDIYMNAWKAGCKAVYYLRTIKEGETAKKGSVCSSCES